MRFHSTVLGVLFFCLSVTASSDTKVISCKITDFVFLRAEEGKPQRYAGFTNSFTVGESIRIEFDLDDALPTFDKHGSPAFHIGIMVKGHSQALNTYVPLKNAQIDAEYGTVNLFEYHYVAGVSMFQRYTIDENNIRFMSSFNELELARYYKDDWHGVYSGKIIDKDPNHYVVSIDCFGADRVIEEVNQWFGLHLRR